MSNTNTGHFGLSIGTIPQINDLAIQNYIQTQQ